jgi:hypothetical protein
MNTDFSQKTFIGKRPVIFQLTMEMQPATNSTTPQSQLARFRPWLVILLVLLAVGFIRVRLLEMPLERDEGEYAYAGQLILQGIPPYELVYNMKLPGTYYAYALGMAVFGQTAAGVHWTLIAANALTIIFVYLLGRKLLGVTAGMVASAAFGVMSVSPAVLGLAAHANHFVILFAVPATLLLWVADESGENRYWFISGLLYGLAFLMKQQGVFFCLFGWLFLLWRAAANKTIWGADFGRRGLIFALGMFLPFGFFCLSCVVAGDFGNFWFWAFQYARSYALADDLAVGWDFLWRHLTETAQVSAGFWLLAAVALPLAFRNPAGRRRVGSVVLFWVLSFLATAAGLVFRHHYFILVLPAFALLIGLAVGSWRQAAGTATGKTIPLLLFVVLLGWDFYIQREMFFRLSPVQACRKIYPGNPFVESLTVAEYIHDHSLPDDRVAVLGSEPEIYFLAQRHSATGYIYTYPLMELQPYAVKMQKEMAMEIESNRPTYLVLVMYPTSWLFRHGSDVTFLRWFDTYANEFYVRVGLVGVDSNGETVGRWGDAANAPNPFGQFIMVYKRKPSAETSPAS